MLCIFNLQFCELDVFTCFSVFASGSSFSTGGPRYGFLESGTQNLGESFQDYS